MAEASGRQLGSDWPIAGYTAYSACIVNFSWAADMTRSGFVGMHSGGLAFVLLTAGSAFAQSGTAVPGVRPGLPATGLVAPVPAGTQSPPPGFVVVQTTYLETLVAAQKVTLEAVAATSQTSINAGQEHVKAIAEVSQSAITAARDKEEWLVRLAQTIGFVFSAIVVMLTYFGVTKYSEVKVWLKEIEQSKISTIEMRDDTLRNATKVESTAMDVKTAMETFQAQEAALKAKIGKADQAADAFAQKLSEIERLFTGMHSQKLILEGLKTSNDKKVQAMEDAVEFKELFEIADKHGNKRVKSFLAATLSLIYMYAEQWDESIRYGEISMQCNPRKWDDRPYNLACVHAMKFRAIGGNGARQSALSLLKQYFEQNGVMKVDARHLVEALLDHELHPVVDGINALVLEYGKHYEVARILAQNFGMEKKLGDRDAALTLLDFCLQGSQVTLEETQRQLARQEFETMRNEIEALLQKYRKPAV